MAISYFVANNQSLRSYLFIAFCLIGISVSAQPESDEILRLKGILSEKPDLKKQTGLYNDLAWEYSYSNFDSAQYYVDLAIAAADKLADPYWQAVSLEMLAILKEISGKNEEAINLYLRVIPIRESIGGKGLENTYNNMAVIFRNQGNHEKAYQYFRESYLIEMQNDNKQGIAGSLINMAITEKQLGRTDSIKPRLWKALAITQKLDNVHLECDAMVNLANIVSERDSAFYYYETAFNKAQLLQLKNSQASIRIGLAKLYKESGQNREALAHYDEAKKLAVEMQAVEYLDRIYGAKADIFVEAGDFKKAYFYRNRSFDMHDSLTNIARVKVTNELETKYETEKKERQLAEQKLLVQKGTDQRRLLIFLAVLLVLGIWFAIYRNRKQQRTSTLLQSKNETIAAALNDREVLLKEIHHRVKNNLQVVSSLLSIQGREIADKKALEAVNESKHRVQSMALIHQYRYSDKDLKRIDMQEYINRLATNLFNAYKLDHDRVKLTVASDPIQLDVDTAIPLGIIINELITNALKYAFPDNCEGELTVKLTEENSRLNLYVSDNGVGKTTVSNADFSFGTKLINAFKNKLKAELEIQTEKGYSVLFSIGKYKKA